MAVGVVVFPFNLEQIGRGVPEYKGQINLYDIDTIPYSMVRSGYSTNQNHSA